jgi:leucyl-tRNA synthetase
MIRMDGTKMSKSKGNLIAPEHYFDTVGADALRLFHLFVGPPFDDMDWSEQTEQVIDGCGKFLDRLWRTCTAEPTLRSGDETPDDHLLRQAVHRTIDEVSRDIDRWSYNTAVAHCMELLNLVQRYGRAEPSGGRGANGKAGADGGSPGPHVAVWNEALDALLSLLAPLAPHVTAELWERRHPGEPSVHRTSWLTADPALVRQDSVTMVVQVNGKVRDRIEVDAAISEADAERLALASAKIVEALKGGSPKRVVSRPPKLVNVVV